MDVKFIFLTSVLLSTLIDFSCTETHGNENKFELERDKYGVLILNSTTFQMAMDKYKTLITLIYIKEAPESSKIVNLMNQVGKIIQDETVDAVLAKLPLEYDNSIFGKYNMDGPFGLIALMDHGDRYVEFTQSLNDANKIMEFIHKKMADPTTEIRDIQEIKKVIETRPCTSVGFFQNFTTVEYEEYRSSADWYYECDHFVTKDIDIFNYFKVENKVPTIRFFKGCIHETFDYPNQLPLISTNMLKYFMVCMEPDVAEYGMNWLMKRVFKQPQFTLILFVKKDDAKKESYVDIMKKYARRYREEINMVYIDVDGSDDVRSFLYTFDLTANDAPILRAIETSNRYGNNTRKYKPKRKAINDASVRQFIGDVYYRQLKPYLVSDPVPKDWNKGPIVTIVGDNFRNVTEDPNTTVLIVFYSDEDRHKSLVENQILQLATEFQKLGRSDIVIGKSNYYSNEYYGWHPNKFPAIILFPKGINRFGIEFDMELTVEDLKRFAESDGQINKKAEKEESSKSKESDEESVTVTDIPDDQEGEVDELVISTNQGNVTSERIEL